MRQLQESDTIKSLGDTPLGSDFPKGAKAEVVDVTTTPTASGGEKHSYKFRADTGIEFQLDHDDLERAVSTGVLEVEE